MKEITLQEFVKDINQQLSAFADSYQKRTVHDKDNYPLEMDCADWWEYFDDFVYCEYIIKCRKNLTNALPEI